MRPAFGTQPPLGAQVLTASQFGSMTSPTERLPLLPCFDTGRHACIYESLHVVHTINERIGDSSSIENRSRTFFFGSMLNGALPCLPSAMRYTVEPFAHHSALHLRERACFT